MRDSYRIIDQGHQPHFLTMSVVGKVPIFTNSGYMNVIVNALKFYQKEHQLKVYAFVIMDNHLHVIVSCQNDLSELMRLLKSYIAKEMLTFLSHDSRPWILNLLNELKKKHKKSSTYQFWEEGNHPKLIQGMEMFNQKVEYIHNNPVKRGLVEKPEHWIYSSARHFAGLESLLDIDDLEV